MDNIILQIQKDLKHKQDAYRYNHTIGVMYTAASLAMRHGCDIQKAMIAGILHDSAKCIPADKKIRLCEKYNIRMTEVERRNPFLLHAKLGAFIAAKNYDIHDNEIISAILNHTTGKPNMSMLDKIIFVADYIEPQRTKAEKLPEIRTCAFENIDKAVALIMKETLDYLSAISGDIDPVTQIAYDYYKKFI